MRWFGTLNKWIGRLALSTSLWLLSCELMSVSPQWCRDIIHGPQGWLRFSLTFMSTSKNKKSSCCLLGSISAFWASMHGNVIHSTARGVRSMTDSSQRYYCSQIWHIQRALFRCCRVQSLHSSMWRMSTKAQHVLFFMVSVALNSLSQMFFWKICT